MIRFIVFITLMLAIPLPMLATQRTVNLTVSEKTVNFTGRPSSHALAVNGAIPAPTLHFKEGDHVTINVYNRMKVGTSIHWHGLLVPWQMDGVSGISQKPIPSGGVFHYTFTLHQSGTYWYHAHEEFQEQQGIYGAFIIDPQKPPAYHYNKDAVVVLSDWNNARGKTVYANLKKEGEYYSLKFPLQPSLMKFIHDYRKATPMARKRLILDYKEMQQMRMSLYDFSDVAYEAYLLNGHTLRHPWKKAVHVGDVIRLRFINAGGSTVYHVKIPHTKMTLVQVDGNDVRPYKLDYFTIAPGETYDVLVRIKQPQPYVIYAESIDTLGQAIGLLTTSPNQAIFINQIKPFPEPKPITQEMRNNMMRTMGHGGHAMDHMMHMPTESSIIGDTIAPPDSAPKARTTPGTQYQPMIAAVKTNDPKKPIKGIIRMELFGYMDHYIWFVNGVPGYSAHPIVLRPGYRYRIIFTNTSMMHHPMHIHGHWFILRVGHGAYDPLLHTIDVPPGATAVADIDTDANGQWFFHCHQLYHMMAGMNRVFQYTTLIDLENGQGKPEHTIRARPYKNEAIVRVDQLPIDFHLVQHPSLHPPHLFMAHFLDVDEDPFNNSQEFTYKGLYGGDYNKLNVYVKEAEIEKGRVEQADMDIFYWRLLSQFWAIKGGANYVYRPAQHPYWRPGIGIEGLMPYFIDTDLRAYYHAGSALFDLELSRDTLIAHHFYIRTGLRGIFATKTLKDDLIGCGINEVEFTFRPYYQFNAAIALYVQYQYTRHYGATKSLLEEEQEPVSQNRYSLGFSFLF